MEFGNHLICLANTFICVRLQSFPFSIHFQFTSFIWRVSYIQAVCWSDGVFEVSVQSSLYMIWYTGETRCCAPAKFTLCFMLPCTVLYNIRSTRMAIQVYVAALNERPAANQIEKLSLTSFWRWIFPRHLYRRRDATLLCTPRRCAPYRIFGRFSCLLFSSCGHKSCTRWISWNLFPAKLYF